MRDKRAALTQEVHDTVKISWLSKQEALKDVLTTHKSKQQATFLPVKRLMNIFCLKQNKYWIKGIFFIEFSVGKKAKGTDPVLHIVCWWIAVTHRSFVAYTALHYMLVRLALHRYGTLTDPAKDDRGTAAIWTALWGVWRRGLTWYQSTGEWCQTLN